MKLMASDFLSEDDFLEMKPKGKDFLEGEFPVSIKNSNLMPFTEKEDFSKGSDIVRDLLYGGGESIGNVLKTLTGGKPDTSGMDYRKNHPESSFNNPITSGLDKVGQQINPTFQMPDIRSKNSNPIAVALGKYAPFALAGGTSFLGSAAGAGAYGATQFEPGKQGYIDKTFGKQSTRTTNAIEDAIIASVLHISPKALSAINPLRYTPKNVANNILKTGETNKKLYSEKYNELFNDAENQGFDDALYNVDIDMKTIKKYTPTKKIVGVAEFNKNPTLENAHIAKSDLMKIENKLNSQTSLNKGERNQLNAVSNAISSLKNNMFKDGSGNLNAGMAERYNQIQRGYANDVIPYKNKAINKFKRNEISNKELINSLKKGEFAAKKGDQHPELFLAPKIQAALATLGLTGAALETGKYLHNSINKQ